jgi:hypothetical protein
MIYYGNMREVDSFVICGLPQQRYISSVYIVNSSTTANDSIAIGLAFSIGATNIITEK